LLSTGGYLKAIHGVDGSAAEILGESLRNVWGHVWGWYLWPGIGAHPGYLGSTGHGPIFKWVDDFDFLAEPLSPEAIQTRDPSSPLHTYQFLAPTMTLPSTATLVEVASMLPVQLPALADPVIPAGFQVITWSYPYDLSDVWRAMAPLCLPWAESKWIEFGFCTVYMGFLWDYWNRRVSLPDEKRLKYFGQVTDFLTLTESSSPRIALAVTQKVHGSLVHICYVHQDGRSHLLALQHFVASYPSRHASRIPLRMVVEDLRWWSARLCSPGAFRILVDRGPPIDLGISVDASTDFGIGLRVGNCFKAWQLLPGAVGLMGRDIGWLETLAIEFSIRYLEVRGVRDANVQVLADNRGSIGAYAKGRGRNQWSNASIQRSYPIAQQQNFEVVPLYVRSAENPADVVSRGLFGGLSHIPETFSVPKDLSGYVYEV
jgi:hypothetical protein